MVSNNRYIGRCFGNNRIIAEVACGSFGCVYQARHVFLDRIVALKILHGTRLQLLYSRDQFLGEARTLEELKHYHILFLYEYGIDNDSPYLVTEYASGGSLRDLINTTLLVSPRTKSFDLFGFNEP